MYNLLTPVTFTSCTAVLVHNITKRTVNETECWASRLAYGCSCKKLYNLLKPFMTFEPEVYSICKYTRMVSFHTFL